MPVAARNTSNWYLNTRLSAEDRGKRHFRTKSLCNAKDPIEHLNQFGSFIQTTFQSCSGSQICNHRIEHEKTFTSGPNPVFPYFFDHAMLD